MKSLARIICAAALICGATACSSGSSDDAKPDKTTVATEQTSEVRPRTTGISFAQTAVLDNGIWVTASKPTIEPTPGKRPERAGGDDSAQTIIFTIGINNDGDKPVKPSEFKVTLAVDGKDATRNEALSSSVPAKPVQPSEGAAFRVAFDTDQDPTKAVLSVQVPGVDDPVTFTS